MVSIIIPSYNQSWSLHKTLESILAQSYKDIEIILVNDASTDTTDGVVEPFLERITYIKHETNRGRQVSRNDGLAAAHGEYAMVCDADIIMRQDCLEKMVHALQEHSECAFSYSSFKWGWKEFKSFPFDIERLKKMNYINMASLVRRMEYPGFDESIGKLQDWDIWLTLALSGRKGCYIPEVLFSLGQQKGGLSTWLPSFIYRIPFHFFGINIQQVENYEKWKKIIQKKHALLVNKRMHF